MAVSLVDVVDDLIPADPAKVNINVGQIGSAGMEKALEVKPVLDGVDVGDAKDMRDEGPGARSAPDDLDAALPGKAENVSHDDEVLAKAEVGDDLKLLGEPLDVGNELVCPDRHLKGMKRPVLGVEKDDVRIGDQGNVESARSFGHFPLGSHALPGADEEEAGGFSVEARKGKDLLQGGWIVGEENETIRAAAKRFHEVLPGFFFRAALVFKGFR